MMQRPFIGTLSILLLFLSVAPSTVSADDSHHADKDQIAARLRSPFFKNLYARTYESLLNRVEPDGFLRESREGEYDRITQWLDFLEKVNTTPVYMEAAGLSADGKSWNESDPGNGEQCAWWGWAMARLRKEVGLSAAP